MYEHPWHSLPLQLGASLEKFNQAIAHDTQFLAFANTEYISKPICFAIKSVGSDDAILFTIKQGSGHARVGLFTDAIFSLAALPNQWGNKSFKRTLRHLTRASGVCMGRTYARKV